MGYRLHVAKTYKVEYALGDAFNHGCHDFHSLLSACGVDSTEDDEYQDEFEVSKEDWKCVIEILKNLDCLSPADRANIQRCLEALDYSAEETIEVMEAFLEEADPDIEYLHLAFF